MQRHNGISIAHNIVSMLRAAGRRPI